MKEIKMFAPNGAEIVGFLAKDGSTPPLTCKYFYRGGEHHFIYEIPEDDWGSTAELSGDIVLVDASGTYWLGADVQNASIPRT